MSKPNILFAQAALICTSSFHNRICSLQDAPFDTDQMRSRYTQLEKSMESRERSYKQRIAGLEQQVGEAGGFH